MKNEKTILILSVSAGAGHVRAAEALKKTTEENFPGSKAIHLDVMEFVPRLFKKIYAESYIKVVDRSPALWGFLYSQTDKEEKEHSLAKKIRCAVQKLNTRSLFDKIDELHPDIVICTHFLPAELLSRKIARGKFPAPVWVVVTDFDIHSLWVHPHMSGYFAASPEVACRMKDKGINPANIHVTGIPIMPVFSRKHSRAECAIGLGVNPEKTTILLMSGGLGVGGIHLIADKLLKIDSNFQMFALAGKNKELLDELNKMAESFPGKLFPTGFTTTIEKNMAASDLAISKPGGLTTSECLAMGLPMIVISPIPGQEERNCDHLLENGAAVKAHNAAVLEFKLRQLLENPARICEMRKAALKIGRPHAAMDILKIVFKEQVGF
ncbi:MAG TPA: galactosyldiacylglycerol synthase [Lentisphaeria bacterium]|nr:MAG: galactosyldiacylglycerol synthase [Lentisphaerae bacterium GWF2_49_21]HBC88243.1 galactosyldiacylglycerol synthase [Lentisphaeria bacterium]